MGNLYQIPLTQIPVVLVISQVLAYNFDRVRRFGEIEMKNLKPGIVLFIIGIVMEFSSCPISQPNPILIDESFEAGSMPSALVSNQASGILVPQVILVDGNHVLKLSSTDSVTSALGYEGLHPVTPLRLSWDYDVEFRIKMLPNTLSGAGMGVHFRFYGTELADSSTFEIWSDMNTSVFSFPSQERIYLEYGTLAQDTWHTIKIESRQTSYTVFINGSEFHTETDVPQAASALQFWCGGGVEIYLDDLSIIRNDIST